MAVLGESLIRYPAQGVQPMFRDPDQDKECLLLKQANETDPAALHLWGLFEIRRSIEEV